MARKGRIVLCCALLIVVSIMCFCACSQTCDIDYSKAVCDTSIDENALFRIACISDLHSQDERLKKQELRTTTINTLNSYAQMNIDVLIMGGDLASGTTLSEEKNNILLNKFDALADAVTSKTLYVVGNHDYSTAHNIYPSSWFPTTKYLYYKYNSADYYNKFMKDNESLKEGLISSYSEYYDNRGHNNAAACDYVLGYHFKISNYHFVCINTHPGDLVGDLQRTNYTYTKGTMDWAVEEISQIDSSCPVFLIAHIPLNDSKNLRKNKGIIEEDSIYFENLLLPYKNVIYLYGHDHKSGTDRDGNETNCFIKEKTEERVTQYYTESGEESFISCFMGSMDYEEIENDPNTAKFDPTIAQGLIIEIYENKIVFTHKNYGVNNGGEFKIEPYVLTIEN